MPFFASRQRFLRSFSLEKKATGSNGHGPFWFLHLRLDGQRRSSFGTSYWNTFTWRNSFALGQKKTAVVRNQRLSLVLWTQVSKFNGAVKRTIRDHVPSGSSPLESNSQPLERSASSLFTAHWRNTKGYWKMETLVYGMKQGSSGFSTLCWMYGT